MLPLTLASVVVAAALAAPLPAHAQGNGRPKAPKDTPGGSSKPSPSPAPTSSPASEATTPSTPTPAPAAAPTPTPTPSPTPTATPSPIDTSAPTAAQTPSSVTQVFSFRQFGAWLDDASAPTPGEGSASIGIGHWRMADASQTNVPMLGGSLGLTDRLQVNASVPFYRVAYQGTTSSGMDDVYLGAKYTLIDPTLTISEFGLAISPVMEVLSAGAPDGRVHFAIPVTMELRRAPMRVYGSAGYFTRGSVFTAAALEWATPTGLVLNGALTQSYSVKGDAILDSLLVSRQRMDVTAGAAYPIGSMTAAFVSVGRSLSSVADGGTSLALSGGMSFRFVAARSTP
jgi:hypothetical protein